jgi:ribosomal protein L11 methyltransferase
MTTEPRYPTLHVRVPDEEIDEASAELFELGATGVEERDATTLDKSFDGGTVLIAHFDTEDQARIAKGMIAWASKLVDIVGDEWRHKWREYFKPSRVGERIVVRPPWEEAETGPGDIVVEIDPGIAFGTGTHESTRLSLAALERFVAGGERMLDIGTGSGILAIVARMLGVKTVLAIDIDPDALKATDENATRNRVKGITLAGTKVGDLVERFPLVMANVESRVLIPHATEVAARVAPGGRLLLAGLLIPELAEIRETYEGQGLTYDSHATERDWLLVSFLAPTTETPKKAAPKKAAPKKAAPKKAAKKAAPKKAAKKAAPKKAAPKKAAKKTAPKKAPSKKAPSKKAPSKKAAPKKAAHRTKKKAAPRRNSR